MGVGGGRRRGTGSTPVANYLFDALDRRIEKAVGGTITRFFRDADEVVAKVIPIRAPRRGRALGSIVNTMRRSRAMWSRKQQASVAIFAVMLFCRISDRW